MLDEPPFITRIFSFSFFILLFQIRINAVFYSGFIVNMVNALCIQIFSNSYKYCYRQRKLLHPAVPASNQVPAYKCSVPLLASESNKARLITDKLLPISFYSLAINLYLTNTEVIQISLVFQISLPPSGKIPGGNTCRLIRHSFVDHQSAGWISFVQKVVERFIMIFNFISFMLTTSILFKKPNF